MLGTALQSIEKILNSYLRLDSDTLDRIGHLQGQLIKVDVEDWQFAVFMKPTSSGIILMTETSQEPSCIIRGNFFNLLQTLQTKKDPQSFHGKITIEGDAHVAQSLQKILKKIDIDWEELFSQYMGDSLAHKLFFHIKKTKNVVSRSLNILKENFQDFIHEEISVTPSKLELEDFYHDIAILRNDTERLSARIDRLIAAND